MYGQLYVSPNPKAPGYKRFHCNSLCLCYSQRQVVQFLAPLPLLLHYLKQLSPDAAQYMVQGKTLIKVHDSVV